MRVRNLDLKINVRKCSRWENSNKCKTVAREPAPALKHKPWRAGSPYVCMETVHACALVQQPVS